MRKTGILLLAALFVAVPLLAQEKEMLKEGAMPMTPPKPIDDELCTWMIGEWEGWTTSPMGKSQDWQKVEWGLDNQFVMMSYTAKMTEANEEAMKSMAKAMGMSDEAMAQMKDMVYKGMGPLTIDPMTGEYVGYWFDNWRGMYKGTGKREGNKITMKWEGPMGTSMRTIERAGEDKLIVTFEEKMPNGEMVKGRSELTRKKMVKKY